MKGRPIRANIQIVLKVVAQEAMEQVLENMAMEQLVTSFIEPPQIRSIKLTLFEFYCTMHNIVNWVDYVVFVIKEMGYPFLMCKYRTT
ncbi:hypothetical protein ACIGHG_03140 [Bacillus sp. NPDC077411]|uniref:Uncharacterized protein n=1 Tax=Bacillus bruguierae TaxID=3127667 RepID=A0ABU8FG72_9BACI